ncbi:putative exonuclease GOR [Harmonia axyridis]|uniref:putative exonuclease GOR n=1 Tax=Harmonia axyridis TaxID=115357 RepID=UPI001E27876C|nr:putative exonuclease GOR [Harmonia axyridis]
MGGMCQTISIWRNGKKTEPVNVIEQTQNVPPMQYYPHPSLVAPKRNHRGEVHYSTNGQYLSPFSYEEPGSSIFTSTETFSGPYGNRFTEDQIYTLLVDFIIPPGHLFINGFPVLNEATNNVQIFKQCFSNPLVVYSEEKKSNSNKDSSHYSKQINAHERICVRCKSGFFITNDEYLTKDPCYFHWGKLLNHSFSCCKQSPGSIGCTTGKLHVWNGTVDGTNEPLEGFVKTKSSGLGNKQNVFALDCEMCYTVKGLELSRVVILSCTGSIVYDHFVKPDNEVVDYNTRYSGVTESDIHSSTAKSFSNVQSDILKLFTEDTILVGHSLDNDLRVLKILHSKIADTSLIFPHHRGFPFKYSLKHLMWTNFGKNIQTSDSGHNPYEDASSCLDLIYLKIRKQQEIHNSQYSYTMPY